jgi:hypothetical protein
LSHMNTNRRIGILAMVALIVLLVVWFAIPRPPDRPWHHAVVRDVALSPDRRTVWAAAAKDVHCGEARVVVNPGAHRWTVKLERRRSTAKFCAAYGCITDDIPQTPSNRLPPSKSFAGDAGCGPYAVRLPVPVPHDVTLVPG